MTLLMWRNHFHMRHPGRAWLGTYRVALQVGPFSVHPAQPRAAERAPVRGDCDAGADDPTWALEYAHFKALCAGGAKTDLSSDIWLHRVLTRLGAEAVRGKR